VLSIFLQVRYNYLYNNNVDLYQIGKPCILYEHPPLGIRDYAEPADPELLSQFEAQVENYSIDEYQSAQVEALCSQILTQSGFPTIFSFDPNDDISEPQHVCAYKVLRIALFQFEKDGGVLDQLQKPIGAHDWIKAQELIKEQKQVGQEDQDTLVSEVETNASDSEGESSGDDDGLVLDLNITT
jgi:hypothetical protein